MPLAHRSELKMTKHKYRSGTFGRSDGLSHCIIIFGILIFVKCVDVTYALQCKYY